MSSSPKIGYFWAEIFPILTPGEAQKHENWLVFVDSSHKQTYLTIFIRFGINRYIFGLFFIDFWSSSPKIGCFWAQISPILTPGEAQKLENWLIFVDSSHKQTYLTIFIRFRINRYIFGLFFIDFRSSSPKIGYFCAQIAPILAPGEVQKLEYWLMFADSSHKQTYLTTTNRSGTHRYIFKLIFIVFCSSSPQICYFMAVSHLYWLLESQKIYKTHKNLSFQIKLGPYGW